MTTLSKRAVVLGRLLKRIGNFGEMGTFDDRLIFQKTVYFLQTFGLYLGYRFSWYVYGPYSPSLTRDGFDLADEFENLTEYEFNDEEAEAGFERFIRFLGERKSDPQWLEALASVHSLRRLYRDASPEDIVEMVAHKQPYFSMKDGWEAWNHLEGHGLLPSVSASSSGGEN